MVISKENLEKIKNIIEKRYNTLLITVLGKKVFTEAELKSLQESGVDTSNEASLLDLIYHHYILNVPGLTQAPKNIEEMQNQQAHQGKVKGTRTEAAEEHLNEVFKSYVDKFKGEVKNSFENIIREENLQYRGKALQDLFRPEEFSNLLKESSVGKIKSKLRELTGNINRNWERVAITEVSNAIGMGSVDRIAAQNRDIHPKDIYVYRVPVNDIKLCKFCKKFYLDADQSPAVYRLSTLLSNGTNYGKKNQDWSPVAGATHPNERCSGILQLRPGWKVGANGHLEYVGIKDWEKYIEAKVRS